MRLKLLFLGLTLIALGYLFCSTPTNPYTDYKNSLVAFISPGQNDTTFFANDSAFFKIQVFLPTLFDSLMLSIDMSQDTSIIDSFKTVTLDTITIPRTLSSADTVMVRIKAVLKNKLQLTDSVRLFIIDRPLSNKRVSWRFRNHRDTVLEGDSIALRVDTLYTVPPGDTASLQMLLTIKQAGFRGDSMFFFRAAARDSGTYPIPVVVSTKTMSDTASITVVVKPRYCTIVLPTDTGGSIMVDPTLSQYRFGDTVSFKTVPASGYLFVQWKGDASGNDTLVRIVVTKNLSVKAQFVLKTSNACMQINSGSINQAIRSASPGAMRPTSICPAKGTYDQGTIKIWGTVRIQLQ